jgi:hypothetical protein
MHSDFPNALYTNEFFYLKTLPIGRTKIIGVGRAWIKYELRAMVEWQWQEKTKVFGYKPVPVRFCPPKTNTGTRLIKPGPSLWQTNN